ncbi:hypothetical protein [Faecalibacterium sp. An77]|uniref:hypothetical protein n=1 Tax=Faecalibacterium sp. An77 TaxID=1965655 RepID=UPI00194EDF7D|nr:hypothetical protein [Faecalibacterium sp. An77]
MKEQSNLGKQETVKVNGCTVRITYASGGEGMESIHQVIQDTLRSSTKLGP